MSHYNPVFIISKTAVMTLPTIAQSPATPRRDIQISRSFNRFHWLSISSNQRLSWIRFAQWENRNSHQPYLLPCWKQLAYELWAKRLFRFVKWGDEIAPQWAKYEMAPLVVKTVPVREETTQTQAVTFGFLK